MRGNGYFPLPMLPEGKEGTVVEVNGGQRAAMRLIEMGFNPGTRVRIMKSHPPGPLIVAVNSTRYAIGRGIAMKIMVEVTK